MRLARTELSVARLQIASGCAIRAMNVFGLGWAFVCAQIAKLYIYTHMSR
jgi:hypothetical protein